MQTIFHLYIQKNVAKPHFYNNINKIIPKQNYNVLSGIMIFCREVQFIMMQPFSHQHREQYISKQNYDITAVQEIHISRFELYKDGPLNLLFLFQKYIFG